MHFYKEQHVKYIQSLNAKTAQGTYEFWLLEHLRLNGIYWGVVALATMDRLDALDADEVVAYVMSCWDSRSGGFGAFPQHDGHILLTLSAVQVLAMYNQLDHLQMAAARLQVIAFVRSMQLADGSFTGDRFGEVDTRFAYAGVAALLILDALPAAVADAAAEWVVQCYNFDGGFGMVPGAESHAAQVFTCVATLAITGHMHRISSERTAAWLSDRQVEDGGLNGRPEKLPDACYSWWVMSSLSILGKPHWVDCSRLVDFILKCQDPQGGIADRADNETDVYHTCFAIAGLCLVQIAVPQHAYGLVPIDPVYCLPASLTAQLPPNNRGSTGGEILQPSGEVG